MSISKKYLKSKPVCKVTFRIPAAIGVNHKIAHLLGTFNDWNKTSLRMKKLVKDGSFSVVVDLEAAKEYEFKYLLDGELWLNDDTVEQKTTHFGDSENSIVSV